MVAPRAILAVLVGMHTMGSSTFAQNYHFDPVGPYEYTFRLLVLALTKIPSSHDREPSGAGTWLASFFILPSRNGKRLHAFASEEVNIDLPDIKVVKLCQAPCVRTT